MTTNPSNLFSPFLPSTYNVPEEDDRLKAFLGEKFSSFSDVINDRKIGVITQEAENFNGEKWFYKTTKKTRNGYQTIVYISSFTFPTMIITLTSVPKFPIQNIDPNFVVTHVWGSASKPNTAIEAGDGDYFSFMAQGDSRVSFTMSDTTITITSTVDLSAYSGFIVIEYLRDGT